ncbi:MAG: hypothetical protein V3V02_10910 [Rhizobiaceae bacterium]
MAARKKSQPDIIHPIGEKLLWVEKPENIKRMIIGLGILCLLLFLGDFIIHRHGHFEIEAFPGFYGVFGFLAFSFIIFATKVLRMVIGRDEDYYAPNAIDAEKYPPEGLEIKEHNDA